MELRAVSSLSFFFSVGFMYISAARKPGYSKMSKPLDMNTFRKHLQPLLLRPGLRAAECIALHKSHGTDKLLGALQGAHGLSTSHVTLHHIISCMILNCILLPV